MRQLIITPLLLFLLTGCTSPLWWYNPERAYIYKGALVVLASQETVMQKCSLLALGCVGQMRWGNGLMAYSVNNPVVLSHECHHLDAFIDEERSVGREQVNDFLLNLTGIPQLAVTVTGLFPAPDEGCGEGTMAAYRDGKWTVRQRQSGNIAILPTPAEVEAGVPIPFARNE